MAQINYATGGWSDDGPSALPATARNPWLPTDYGDTPVALSADQKAARDAYIASINPAMLTSDGVFKGPNEGVNYQAEGMTPGGFYDSIMARQAYIDASNDGSYGDRFIATPLADKNDPNERVVAPNARNYNPNETVAQALDPSWRPGAISTDSMLQGHGNMWPWVARFFTMAAGGGAFAGEGAGAAVGGTEVGGSAGIGSGTVAGGGAAAPTTMQSVVGAVGSASPYVQPAISAANTIAHGGNLGDVAKGAALSYVGNAAGNAVGGAVGSATDSAALGQAAGSVTSSVVQGGNPVAALTGAGLNAAAGQITGNIDGFSELSLAQKNMITNMVVQALQGKNPTQALIKQVTNLANNQVAQGIQGRKNTSIRTGGWSA